MYSGERIFRSRKKFCDNKRIKECDQLIISRENGIDVSNLSILETES